MQGYVVVAALVLVVLSWIVYLLAIPVLAVIAILYRSWLPGVASALLATPLVVMLALKPARIAAVISIGRALMFPFGYALILFVAAISAASFAALAVARRSRWLVAAAVAMTVLFWVAGFAAQRAGSGF